VGWTAGEKRTRLPDGNHRQPPCLQTRWNVVRNAFVT
jgi:hypothetical protein